MNFRLMPELSWHYGYWVVLLAMLSIALGLIWYFYRKGWFR
jgi:magnesium transporter